MIICQKNSDDKVFIKPCADFMVDKTNDTISLINFDDSNNLIKLADESF